jgi:hypothetical protein
VLRKRDAGQREAGSSIGPVAPRGRPSHRSAKPTADDRAIAQVGTISANSDESIGTIIADAMKKVAT